MLLLVPISRAANLPTSLSPHPTGTFLLPRTTWTSGLLQSLPLTPPAAEVTGQLLGRRSPLLHHPSLPAEPSLKMER